MKKMLLFSVDTPYRHARPVCGWSFGPPGSRTLAVVGALRGNEIQQMYTASHLIRALEGLEREKRLSPDCGILVVPCANQFSMNVGRRFWAADNTDINRMFPGYEEGETTQRLAARLFEALKGFRWGVHLTSFYLPGDHLSHIRLMETGHEPREEAAQFGLPYVVVRRPQPYDTTTLAYNWPVWDTRTFALYTREIEDVDPVSASQAVEAILRFLTLQGAVLGDPSPAPASVVFQEQDLRDVLTTAGGLLVRSKEPGDRVVSGDVLARLTHPCTGEVLEELKADRAGTVFFARKPRLVCGHEVAFRILPD